MTTILKTLVAGLATATVALAFAQGNPPNPAVSNPAQGAGQRSSQNTPMGTTGTPGGGATAQGSMGTGSASSAATSSAATSAGATAGSSTTMASDSMGSKSSTKHTTKKAKKKVVKADRG